MWIKIKEQRLNFDKVSDYAKTNGGVKLFYQSFLGECNDDQFYELIPCDTEIEAKAIIKQLDKILNVVEL